MGASIFRYGGAISLGLLLAAPGVPASNCTFTSDPDRFLAQEARARRHVSDTAAKFRATARRDATVDAASIPRNNVIDEAIFGLLAEKGVKSARLTTDEEFLRRIYFDLTGHPPTAADVRRFVEDSDEGKRAAVIQRLLSSDDFNHRWTLWFGDLFLNAVFPQNFDRQTRGRNGYYQWILYSLGDGKSIKDIALESVASTGNNYNNRTGGTNFPLNGITPMSPVQDTYDNILKVTATTFLGLSHYDCLLCHDGRNRLNLVSLWGSQTTRVEAQRMAAFFSRISMSKPRLATTELYYNSYDVSDAQGGNYNLTTPFGNRPARQAINGNSILLPEYRDGRKPDGAVYRQFFAQFMIEDPMFAINWANRLWKEMFTLGLVEPIDSLDPARLDPENPPAAPWSLQATHPALLKLLADELVARNYSLREFLRLLVESSAYQLSSRYEGDWKPDYVNLFARHYPRRLEGEEVHDAIVIATQIKTNYTLSEMPPTPWAMQMPDPLEPRTSGATVNFMLPFFRGNRDSFFRIQDGSIQQQLNLMNDTFILNRIRTGSSPILIEIAKIGDNEQVVEELFLTFLQRRPDGREKAIAVKFLSGAGSTRNAYIEDIAWALVNKTDFLYNY